MIEMPDCAGEVAGLGESPEMQLVNDHLLPAAAAPAGVAPVIGRRIDDLARAMHAFRLMAGSRVGQSLAVERDSGSASPGPAPATEAENQPPGSRAIGLTAGLGSLQLQGYG